MLVFVGCSPDVLLVLGSMGLFTSREGPVSQTSRAAENVVIAGKIADCYLIAGNVLQQFIRNGKLTNVFTTTKELLMTE